MDSYKHLDKICGEMFNANRGVSAYIDEMTSIFDGNFYVSSWEEDLKKLKYCRFVRNRIAHDVACTEDNMCSFEDVEWLEDFYSRIMNQTDPLSLYRLAKSKKEKKAVTTPAKIPVQTPVHNIGKQKKPSAGCSTFLFLAVGIIIALALILINI